MEPTQISQKVIVFSRETFRNFRAECIRRDTSPTKEINRLVEEQLAEWAQSLQGGRKK